jgi:hypothetical protein
MKMLEYPYTEEQVMIRAMPCPECGADPRKFCKRKPNQNGRIRSHEARMLLWHEFVKSAVATKQVDLWQCESHFIKGHPDYDYYLKNN